MGAARPWRSAAITSASLRAFSSPAWVRICAARASKALFLAAVEAAAMVVAATRAACPTAVMY